MAAFISSGGHSIAGPFAVIPVKTGISFMQGFAGYPHSRI
jgi:hypothetical protein